MILLLAYVIIDNMARIDGMKKIILILLMIFILIIGFYFFDYIRVTKYDKNPIIALKEENTSKQFTVYKALFYKVWVCTYKDENKKMVRTIGSYNDEDPICTKAISFTDGYYKNPYNVKISLKDYQTMMAIYDIDDIDTWQTNDDLNNALYVVNELEKSFFTIKDNSTFTYNNEIVNIAIFFDLVQNSEDNEIYTWQVMTNDESYYYCIKQDSVSKKYLFAKYQNNTCNSIWSFKNFTDKWCELVKSESNSIIKEYADANCSN